MDQDYGDHEIRAPAVQGSNEPTKRDAVIESLEAVPRLSGRRHIDQRKQYAGDNLQHKTRERGAAEYVEPTCGLARNRMPGSFANRRTKLQPEIEPLADFLNQAHVVPPGLVSAARPGVGISPALIKIFPSSILWLY